MTIAKPYCRIWRPQNGYDPNAYNERKSVHYLYDDRFVNQGEMRTLITTCRLMFQDLYQLFYFIEPHDTNLNTFSHRVYELYFRATTEFESNCKRILEENGYSKSGNWYITDYEKISSVARLPEYRVKFKRWATPRDFTPFADWSTSGTSLSWYQDYNKVKHNRYDQFSKANLNNLMNAFAALLCIIHAQCGVRMTVGFIDGLHVGPDNQEVLDFNDFTIFAPHFPETEQYDFVWDDIKDTTNPVQQYDF